MADDGIDVIAHEWHDLGDDELRRRFEQRQQTMGGSMPIGHVADVDYLVAHRDDERAAEVIDRILGGGS